MNLHKNLGVGRHFERLNVERLIFRNLKIVNVKKLRGPVIRFFYSRKYFSVSFQIT